MDGTLIQAWAGRKGLVPKDDNEDGPGEASDKSAECHGGFMRAPQQRHPPLAQRPRQPPDRKGKTGTELSKQPARPDRQHCRHLGRWFCRRSNGQGHAQRRQPMRAQADHRRGR